MVGIDAHAFVSTVRAEFGPRQLPGSDVAASLGAAVGFQALDVGELAVGLSMLAHPGVVVGQAVSLGVASSGV